MSPHVAVLFLVCSVLSGPHGVLAQSFTGTTSGSGGGGEEPGIDPNSEKRIEADDGDVLGFIVEHKTIFMIGGGVIGAALIFGILILFCCKCTNCKPEYKATEV